MSKNKEELADGAHMLQQYNKMCEQLKTKPSYDELVKQIDNLNCKLGILMDENKKLCDELNKSKVEVDMDIYDTEEIHENCTVQIWSNSKTGKISIGWWKNDN